ncbi:hypothetical protein [Aureimonas glaciei]|nr:hypothetical protein [Aureimonas glaciei]
MTRKSIFRIELSEPMPIDDMLSEYPLVTDMDDTDTQSYETVPVRAVNALAACGIHTYSDLHRAPQAKYGKASKGRCLEDIRGVSKEALAALIVNLHRLLDEDANREFISSREDAEEALTERDPELQLWIRDVAHNNDYEVGRMYQGMCMTVAWFPEYSDIVSWAKDDSNFDGSHKSWDD